jgi:hypothetical protein
MRALALVSALMVLADTARSQDFAPGAGYYYNPNPAIVTLVPPVAQAQEPSLPQRLPVVTPVEAMMAASYQVEPEPASPSDIRPVAPMATAPTCEGIPSCVEEPVCCSRRYVQVDGLFWHRVGAGCIQPLVFDTDPEPDEVILDTGDLRFNLTGGVRFLVGWTPDCCSRCTAWELSYFGLYGWQANASVASETNNLSIPGDLGASANNFLNASLIDANYQSDFHNFELNCIKSCCVCEDQIDFLCGLRFIYLDERFTLTAEDFPEEGVSSYDIDADNYLYGVQLGGRYTRNWCNWSLQFTGKAGVFLNDARQSQFIFDEPEDNVIRDVSGSGNQVAALGEIGIIAIKPINDTWSLRFGYQALGLGGVALATDQLDFTDNLDGSSGTGINTYGWVFLHGGLLGLEATW